MATPVRLIGRRVWDPLVRITHWIIALAILANGLLLRDGTVLHVWIGYAALSALILRILWGIIAPGPARLVEMPLAPAKAVAHVRNLLAGQWHDSPGHTPLGAWMALAIWVFLGLTSATGLAMEADPFPSDETHHAWSEYRYEHEDDDEEHSESAFSEVIEGLHEASASVLVILAALHIAGVGLESRLAGVNLAKEMSRTRRERSK